MRSQNSRWFFLKCSQEVSTYKVAPAEGHVSRVIYIPSWPRSSSKVILTIRRAIEVAFSLMVNPPSLDLINEPHIRTFGLVPMDNDKASLVPMVATLTIVAPSGLITQDDTVGLTSMVVTSIIVFFARRSEVASTYRSETTKLSMLVSRTISKVSTPVKTALDSRGDLSRI